jgi:hypothetical protein
MLVPLAAATSDGNHIQRLSSLQQITLSQKDFITSLIKHSQQFLEFDAFIYENYTLKLAYTYPILIKWNY